MHAFPFFFFFFNMSPAENKNNKKSHKIFFLLTLFVVKFCEPWQSAKEIIATPTPREKRSFQKPCIETSYFIC